MAEIQVNIYFRHEDVETHRKLVRLFETEDAAGNDQACQAFINLATEINPEKGDGIAKAFLRDVDEKIREWFGFENISDIAGFCCARTTCGGAGDRFAARCVKLLYHLCPGIQALAWGMGDDDPWEFWFKHVDGHLVRHDAEPFDGYDKRIRSTIYRWWHEGLPDEIREGMLNDSNEDDEYDDSNPVTEEEYQQWLSGHAEGSDVADDVEEVVMDELVSAFTSALGGLFSGGSAKKTVSPDAFDAETVDEDLVRRVVADMGACQKMYDIDGIMKHISKSLQGSVTTSIDGQETTVPISHGLYRMSLKLVLKEDAEYEAIQDIGDIKVDGDSAAMNATTATTYIDPATGKKMNSKTEDEFTLEIVDNKIQVTGLVSKELANTPA